MSARRATSLSARHRARELAFRVVYQADVTGETCAHTWAAQTGRDRLTRDQRALIDDIVRALDERRNDLDAQIHAVAPQWPLDRMSATDRSVLRTALAELVSRPGTPARVVLDEAIEIAKRYGSDASGGFVNGVLDRLARELRAEEF